jgi:peptide/nickel transport system permease protein
MFFTAVQVYIAGLVLQYLVVFRWGWLPMPGYQPISEGLINWVQGLILPWITLGLALAGSFARIFRTKLVELIPADFVRTGRALGQSKSQLIRYNLIRPSLGPVLALFGLVLGELLGGTVLTELVFNISGVGKLTADAITYLDLPLLVGVLIVSTFFVVLGNLIADLLHYLTDPRIALRD